MREELDHLRPPPELNVRLHQLVQNQGWCLTMGRGGDRTRYRVRCSRNTRKGSEGQGQAAEGRGKAVENQRTATEDLNLGQAVESQGKAVEGLG